MPAAESVRVSERRERATGRRWAHRWAGEEDTRELYAQQMRIPGYVRLLRGVRAVMGTWDDHDYGENNAGVEFAAKRTTQVRRVEFTPPGGVRGTYVRGVSHGHVCVTAVHSDAERFQANSRVRDGPRRGRRRPKAAKAAASAVGRRRRARRS